MPAARIIVTGANGFVGQWLERELRARQPDLAYLGFGRDDLDITDAEAVASMVASFKPSAIIHLAAIAAPLDARRSPRQAWDVNAIGTFNVAQATMEHAPDASFIYVGSADAYGASLHSGLPVKEAAALNPLSVYGATKAAADLMVGQMAAAGLNAVRFRPFNHTGPGQSTAFVAPAFARQVAEIKAGRKQPVIEVGNLSPERDFCDVRDIVRAYAAAALGEAPAPAGTIYNLASGKPTRIGAILERLIALSPRPIEVKVDAARVRDGDIPVVLGDASAAADQFGWRVEIPFEQTLHDLMDYWDEQVATEK